MSGPHDLETTARTLVAPRKGILAADESMGTISKRLKSAGIEPSDDNRRAYREMLLTAPGLGEFISGVILFDETLRQTMTDGRPIVAALQSQGIMPGIKVDRGAKPLAGFSGEKITEGLDGLRERLAEYATLGATFAKWRAVIAIASAKPTRTCLAANAEALARYAALCQEAGLVPIVEPEVLMDGDHAIERHAEATTETLRHVFGALHEHRVRHEAMLLKPNMVLSGSTCPRQATTEEVARATWDVLQRSVPAAVPGIVFLSGGQGEEQAASNLNALNALGGAPWELSFSFGRALQATALEAWAGQRADVAAAQGELLHRARCASAARAGEYSRSMERR